MDAVVIGEDLDDDAPDSAEDVADAIDDFVDGGGILPPGFGVLDFLDGDVLADALAQISGEAATGVAPTATQAMDSFLDTVLNQGPGGPGEETAPRQGTVKALGYAPQSSGGAGADMAQAFGALLPAPDPRLWGVWAAVYGGNTEVDGNATAGTHDRSSDNYGAAFGLDYQITAATKVGLALSGGATSFNLADGFGSGSSTMFQGAIYSRSDFDAAYIAGVLAYAYHDQSTDRTVSIVDVNNRYTADFDAFNIAGHLEAGYRLGWLTPYGAVRVQVFHTPDYSETPVSGSAPGYALDYDEQTTTTTRTELGARLHHTLPLNDGASLILRGRVAWAHDFSPQPSINASLQTAPVGWTVYGAQADRDSVLLSAGAEILLASGFSVAGWFDGQLSENSQAYAGNARVRYEW
jgi:outer membrane autotransporter protein